MRKWRDTREKPWRIPAIKRDQGICQICKRFIGNSIDVHHLDEKGITNAKPNHNLNNLICLCHRCHLSISDILYFKRKYKAEKILKKLLFQQQLGQSN